MVKLTEQGQIQGKWQSCSKQEYQRPDLLGGAPQKKRGIIISKVSFLGSRVTWTGYWTVSFFLVEAFQISWLRVNSIRKDLPRDLEESIQILDIEKRNINVANVHFIQLEILLNWATIDFKTWKLTVILKQVTYFSKIWVVSIKRWKTMWICTCNGRV